ncbi:3-oxoacyl-ACP synthase, partial [Saccharothrix sp. MB29]|nr:3-oxoacyl-ACP synthase [Saccharothrix sp. MB29]
MQLAIRALAHYLPDTEVAVADLPEAAGLTQAEAEVFHNLGIERIRADDGLSATDLAVRAAGRALDRAGLAASDVDALIVVESRTPEALLSSETTRVQSLLGAERAIALGVGGLGCVSLTPALMTAAGLLAADPAVENVLVVHGSKPATP